MSESKISFTFELVPEDEVITTSRKKALPKWTPLLSWDSTYDISGILECRGYTDLTKDDVEFVRKHKADDIANQHRAVDKEIELLGIRSKNVLAVRNQKEVRIKL